MSIYPSFAGDLALPLTHT